jgi:hypothetical protein
MASCPFCGSPETEEVSPWGGQIITSQARCRSCESYFEVVREWTTSYDDDQSERQQPGRSS